MADNKSAHESLEQHFKTLFTKATASFKTVRCYGRQIVVECYSNDAAKYIAYLLKETKMFKIKGIVKSLAKYNDKLKKDEARKKPVYIVYAMTRWTF